MLGGLVLCTAFGAIEEPLVLEAVGRNLGRLRTRPLVAAKANRTQWIFSSS